jgi:hypothetical protein
VVLTQKAFEELCDLPVLLEAEDGKIVQSSSMDTLLRLLRDVPETREYLEKMAA